MPEAITMQITQEQRQQAAAQLQGAVGLQIAFIGLANGLLARLDELDRADAAELAAARGLDTGYVERWCDAAYAFGYLEEEDGRFCLSGQGRAFLPDAQGTLMPFAVQAVLSAHMAERAAGLMRSGERPGERVLAERAAILPWFGPMLEAMFGATFEERILPAVPVFREVGEQGGLAVDLGCGNGWYLRRLALRFAGLRGLGLDTFDENIRQAQDMAHRQGLADRLAFRAGDILGLALDEPAQLIAMNRALHHVWQDKDRVFAILARSLKPGGCAVIWEPDWPAQRATLREPARRGLAFQHLSEHVQGNRFLRPEEIEAEFHKVGMATEVFRIEGGDAVVVGRKPA